MSEEEMEIIDILSEIGKDEIRKILKLVEDQQKEIEELKQNKKDNIQVVYGGRRCGTEGMIVKDYISKDKIRKYFMHEIAFKKRLQREKQKIDKYNRGRFDTIEEILELLEEN